MASPNLYVRSTGGSDTDNGTTWDLAKATLVGAAAIDSTTDYTIWVSQAHAESTASSIAPAFAGTATRPTLVLCGDDSAEPPTALATTATLTTSASSNSISGNCYVYGLTFISSVAAGGGFQCVGSAADHQVYESCKFRMTANDTRPRITISGNGSGTTQGFVEFKNTQVKFANAGQYIMVNAARFEWVGGGLESGTTSPTYLLQCTSDRVGGDVLLSGLDLSAAGTGSGMAIFGVGNVTTKNIIRNCKLPASWAGTLTSGTLPNGYRAEMYNCDAGDTNYRLWIDGYAGSIKSETTIVKSSGATDGTTPLSWVMTSSGNVIYPHSALRSPEIVQWNETIGSALTCTVEIVHDTNAAGGQGAGTSYAYQDDEVWLEVQYLGTSGVPLGEFISDAPANVLTAAADQASSSVTWTTTGLTTPVKQKLEVTFTPQEKGFVHAVVCVGKASKTVYVDPLLTIA